MAQNFVMCAEKYTLVKESQIVNVNQTQTQMIQVQNSVDRMFVDQDEVLLQSQNQIQIQKIFDNEFVTENIRNQSHLPNQIQTQKKSKRPLKQDEEGYEIRKNEIEVKDDEDKLKGNDQIQVKDQIQVPESKK